VFTITVDNASANDVGVEYMRKRMKNKSHKERSEICEVFTGEDVKV